NAAAGVIVVPLLAMQLELISRMMVGNATHAEAVAGDLRASAMNVGLTLLRIPTAIVFVVWLHRAYGNTRAWKHAPQHRVGWAIGAFFIPIVNYFLPYQI